MGFFSRGTTTAEEAPSPSKPRWVCPLQSPRAHSSQLTVRSAPAALQFRSAKSPPPHPAPSSYSQASNLSHASLGSNGTPIHDRLRGQGAPPQPLLSERPLLSAASKAEAVDMRSKMLGLGRQPGSRASTQASGSGTRNEDDSVSRRAGKGRETASTYVSTLSS